MKTTTLTFILLLLVTTVNAQSNSVKAKSEFFAAEDDYNAGNYSQCITHLNQVETLLGSTNPRILHLKIKAYCNTEQYADAYEAQKKYFELATDENDSKYNEIVRLLSKINENTVKSYADKALEYHRNKQYGKAIEEIEKALKIDKEDMYAHYLKGLTLFYTENFEKSLEEYTLVINSPQSSSYLKHKAYNYIGRIYAKKKNYTEAIYYTQKVINIAEKNNFNIKYSYYNLACYYSILKNKTEALKYLEITLNNGYKDIEYLKKDPDLDYIRTTEEFKNIISRTDFRDGKIYKIVKIGNQIWMAENLNYKTENSYCYDDKTENCEKYGRLYTYEAALNACPAGWHLPSDDEWKELEIYLGMSEKQADKKNWRGTTEGSKLKSTIGWDKNGNGTNESGFTALPGGYRSNYGTFYGIGSNGYWWRSTEDSTTNAYSRYLYDRYASIGRGTYPKELGFSVRCVRDY